MKILIGLVVALFSAVGLAWLVRQDAGYVLVTVGSWTIETSVAAALVIVILGFFVGYKLLRYTGRLLRMPRTLGELGRRRRERRASRLLATATKSLAEGRPAAAEAAFQKGLALSTHNQALYLVGAARAAHRQGAKDRRDRYLEQAAKLPRDTVAVVGIARAELLLEDDDVELAAKVLHDVQILAPNQPRVLELQLDIASRLGDWEHALRLLPQLRKRKLLDDDGFRDAQLQVHRERLAACARQGKLPELQRLWGEVPKALRSDESLLIDYVGQLRELDAAEPAEALLKQAIGQHWSNALCVAYGQLARGDANAQLASAESWLAAQKDNPYLLLTLGRLAVRARKMDKARGYLEQSLKLMPMGDTYQVLGELLEGANDASAAIACYRAGLHLLSGHETVKEGVALPAEKALSA